MAANKRFTSGKFVLSAAVMAAAMTVFGDVNEYFWMAAPAGHRRIRAMHATERVEFGGFEFDGV